MRKDSMNGAKNGQGGCFIMMLSIAAVVVIIFAVFWAAGLIRFESAPETMEQEDSAERIITTSSSDFMVTETEWKSLQSEVKRLHSEVNQLKQGNTKPVVTRQAAPNKLRWHLLHQLVQGILHSLIILMTGLAPRRLSPSKTIQIAPFQV